MILLLLLLPVFSDTVLSRAIKKVFTVAGKEDQQTGYHHHHRLSINYKTGLVNITLNPIANV